MLMFSLKWQRTNHTRRAQSPLLRALPFPLNLPVWINLSVGIHQKRLASHFGELPPLKPNSAAADGWCRDRFGGKRQSSIGRANPFQLNLNNQSVRELRIQAGQKAKVLLLSLLQHHLPWDVMPSGGHPLPIGAPQKKHPTTLILTEFKPEL